MTNILNLDEIKPAEGRVLKLNGKEYRAFPLTVSDFIDLTKAAKRLEANSDPVEQFELVLSNVRRSFPGMEESEIRTLSFPQLVAIMKWLRADAETPEGSSEGNVSAARKKA